MRRTWCDLCDEEKDVRRVAVHHVSSLLALAGLAQRVGDAFDACGDCLSDIRNQLADLTKPPYRKSSGVVAYVFGSEHGNIEVEVHPPREVGTGWVVEFQVRTHDGQRRAQSVRVPKSIDEIEQATRCPCACHDNDVPLMGFDCCLCRVAEDVRESIEGD